MTTASRLGARPVALAPSAMIALAFLYAFVRGSLYTAHLGRTFHGFLWMFAMLGAFLGAGSYALRRFGVARPPLALSGALGMAAFIAVGGVALLLGAASRPYLVLSVGIGLALGVPSLLRFRLRRRWWTAFAGRCRRSPVAFTAVALIVAFLLGDVFIRVGSEVLHPRDDLVAYVPLAQDIVDHGSSIQPFSFRRACVLGGQELLDATFLAPHADPRLLRAVESGLGGLLLLLFALDSRRKLLPRLLPLLALASLPILPIQNLASDHTTAVLLLAVMMLGGVPDLAPKRRVLVAAVLLAALVTLRNTNLVPAIVIVALERSTATEDRDTRVRGALASIACMAALLLPWLYASYRSNESWFFPIDHGYYQPAFALVTGGTPGAGSIATTIYGASFGSGLWFMAAIATAALLGRAHQAVLLRTFAATGALLLILVLRVADTERAAMTRYLHPFLTAVWVGAAIFAARAGAAPRGRMAQIAAMVGIGAVLTRGWTLASEQRSYYLFEALRHAGGDHDRTRLVLDSDGPRTVEPTSDRPPHEVDYAALQGLVPEGETILAMVDDPAKLDFVRNPIWIVDLPGAEAPPPGYPDEANGVELALSLRKTGVRWVLVVLPGRSTDAYLTATYHTNKTASIGRMLGRIEAVLQAYQTLPPILRAGGNEDLALYDLTKAD